MATGREMKRALLQRVVPVLRVRGFAGEYPHSLTAPHLLLVRCCA